MTTTTNKTAAALTIIEAPLFSATASETDARHAFQRAVDLYPEIAGCFDGFPPFEALGWLRLSIMELEEIDDRLPLTPDECPEFETGLFGNY